MRLKNELIANMNANQDGYQVFVREVTHECKLASMSGRAYYFIHMPFNFKYMQRFAKKEDLRYMRLIGTNIHGVAWGDLPKNPSDIRVSSGRVYWEPAQTPAQETV